MEDIIIILGIAFNLNLPLLTAWLLDHWLGDPAWLPHPVVAFGKAISFCEHRLNRGNARFLKGAAMSLLLVLVRGSRMSSYSPCAVAAIAVLSVVAAVFRKPVAIVRAACVRF